MMHTNQQIRRIAQIWLAVGFLLLPNSLKSADRTTLLVPLADDAEARELPVGRFADEAFGEASDGWKAYIRLWKAHHQDPGNPAIRRFLGLPLKGSFQADAKRGRSAPSVLRWKAGSYAQVDTPHFVIHSRAAEAPSRFVAEDLERAYWIWTQMFFPLWEANAQVSKTIGGMPADVSVQEFLESNPARITIRRKLRVVLFRDANEYQQTLSREVPGVERSTGYYDNGRQTIFLYAAQPDDGSTRRHELVHQMFREATRSGLRQQMPASDSGFWLIEGIAGYFESLQIQKDFATVGGWDASRLQFARFRVLVNGDQMSMNELHADGFKQAQKRSDIARWYSHAIARTHQLLDGGDVAARQAIYQQLALRYKIRTDLQPSDVDLAFGKADPMLRDFLRIGDADLIQNVIAQAPRQLVLAECQVSEKGVQAIPAAANLAWLDLAGIPVTNNDVSRLAPRPTSITQLRLERTAVDSGLKDWLKNARNLRELDLSSTPIDDSVVGSVAAPQLSILWLTGTKVSDASIDRIGGMKQLESVDLQKTNVTQAGIARLRAARPKLEINPLHVQ
ncbi:MAG: hypothetical protein AB8B91_11120 [Rubripirellula sp.]